MLKIHLILTTILMAASVPAFAEKPIPVKVVVLAMYEMGEITGDRPGELQFWAERESLDIVLPFPMGRTDLLMSEEGLTHKNQQSRMQCSARDECDRCLAMQNGTWKLM